MKKKAFTILEVIIAITSFFLLLIVIINIYTKMMRLKYNIQARTNITQDAYFAIEKINILLKDYTIDYEEYFNRKNVGCDSYSGTFTWNTEENNNGYCDLPTGYGNQSNIDGSESNERKIYFCSSTIQDDTPYKILQSNNVQNGDGCLSTGKQSFGQYYRQFRDVKNDVDSIDGARNDDDDENVMKGPSAIEDMSNAKELYLISQDGSSRIFIRRILVESGDRNNDGLTGNTDSEKLYTLQILKLKGFDAGNNHNFDVNTSSGVYDGKIDTRACDRSQGFICNGDEVSNLYSGYHMPADQNDGRVNLFQRNITISDRNINISPHKNPQYALAQNETQINPYFTINLTSRLYGEIRQKKLGLETIDNFKISLQTTFNTKNFYTR